MASYADIAAKGPKQTPEEAAAPQPPSVSVSDVETSTSSLVDVDTPSVHTVPADFREQEVKTETQADRLEQEAKEAEDRARAEADLAKKKAKRSAHKADSWLTSYFENLSEGAAATLAVSNFVAVLGLSGWLGYKAYGLYERRVLGWKHAGIGLGVLGVVGAFEGVFTTYLNKGKNKKA